MAASPEDETIDQLVADFTSKSSASANEAVTRAASHPDALNAVKALQAAGLDINAQNGYQDTLLNEAISSPNPELVTYLLDQGADPNFYYQGVSPLSTACQARDVPASVVSQLLAKGARTSGNEPALHYAAYAGSSDKVALLLGKDADVTALAAQDGPYMRRGLAKGTALHEAAGAHYVEAEEQKMYAYEWDPEDQERTVKLLLAKGADPGARDDRGRVALDWVDSGPGYKNVSFKKPEGADVDGFNEQRHLERMRALLKESKR